VNCPQHIPQKFNAGEVDKALTEQQARIDALEAENSALRQQILDIGNRS
jgi:hypothetical protein